MSAPRDGLASVLGVTGDTGSAMPKVTLQSIADRVGVSRMTVSNAFSRPDQLSAELRERILSTADELGYVGPDPAARALARGKVGSVGLLLTDELGEAFHDLGETFRDAVATEFLTAVADALNAEGLAVTLLRSGRAGGPFVPARDVAMDGAIIYICDPASPDIAWLERRGMPLVLVDRDPSPNTPSVNVADREGARSAAQHLVDLGHTRIGIVTLESTYGGIPNLPARERLAGWREAMTPAGIEPVVVEGDKRPYEAIEDVVRDLLDGPDRPTAVLCFSDAFALATMRVATALGLRVPDDLSVVGYDDSPLASVSSPPLTTVHQEVSTKGQEAVRLLVRRMRQQDGGDNERVLLPTRLVVRESTAPPPQR